MYALGYWEHIEQHMFVILYVAIPQSFLKSICEGGKLKELDKERRSPLQIAHDNVGV